jgi:hypothetical protein
MVLEEGRSPFNKFPSLSCKDYISLIRGEG